MTSKLTGDRANQPTGESLLEFANSSWFEKCDGDDPCAYDNVCRIHRIRGRLRELAELMKTETPQSQELWVQTLAKKLWSRITLTRGENGASWVEKDITCGEFVEVLRAETIDKPVSVKQALDKAPPSRESEIVPPIDQQHKVAQQIASEHMFDPREPAYARCVGAIMQAWRPGVIWQAEAPRKPSTDEHARFEHWCREELLCDPEHLERLTGGKGAYRIHNVQCFWMGWNARAELREVSQHPIPAPLPKNLHGWRTVCTSCGCAPNDKSCNFNCVCHGEHPEPAPRSEYQVDRYRNGRKMAEGAKVTATSANEALEKARKLFYPLMQGETFVIEGEHPEPTKEGTE